MGKFKPLAMGFHSHTDVGSLDGGSTVMQKAKRAKALGRIADVVTDHGTMSAIASHNAACSKCGIRSIHGVEAYIIDPFQPTRYNERLKKDEFQYVHLTIHFKTKEAFQYFSSLTPIMESRAVIRGGERKPLLMFEELQPIADQITVGSGCLVGMVQKYVKNKEFEKCQRAYEMLRNLVPKGNFFVEVFPHHVTHDWVRPKLKDKVIVEQGYFRQNECGPDGMPIDLQKAANQFVIEMAKKYGDPIVISEDSHLAESTDKVVQDIRLGNGMDAWRFYNPYHMAETDEWAKNLKYQLDVSDRDIEEWIDNSYQFVELFKDYKFATAKDGWLLPRMEDVYEVKSGTTTKDKLKELIRKHNKMVPQDHPNYHIYAERLKREVDVLADNGIADFLPYFFVLEDVCSFCKKEGILFNTRGSAGGSLVLYLLGCSITDPIKYNLQFERFLTLGRIKSGTLPDIDMDFSDRDPIIVYLRGKYGNKMAPISIQRPLKLKSSIKDIERVKYGEVRVSTEEMCKLIPTTPQGVDDFRWIFGYEDEITGEHVPGFIDDTNHPGSVMLRAYSEANTEIWETVLKCIGVMREKSIHTCGVIISPRPITETMPLLQISDQLCTAYGPKDVEAVGGVKFDFLGLTTLKALEITMKSVNERTGSNYVWEEYAHDPQVYKDTIEAGKDIAIFQINTNTMRPFTKKINPKTIEEGSAQISLVRPGCLDADSPDPVDAIAPAGQRKKTAADYYIECAQGKRKPYYIHPDLEPILKESFGICLYQEQHLRIFRDVGEMTFEQAEVARRAIGKKDKELLKQELGKLHSTCLKRGWTDTQATALYDMIAASARYAFNKSHSTSYFILSYNGCWFKKHFPLDFWKGELTAHAGDNTKTRSYMDEAREYIEPIDILKSDLADWKIKDNRLVPPIRTIKGVGEAVSRDLKRFLEIDLSDLNRKPAPVKKSKLYKCNHCNNELPNTSFPRQTKKIAETWGKICKNCFASKEETPLGDVAGIS